MNVLAFENHPTAFAGGQERSLFEALQFMDAHGEQVSLCYQQRGELLEKYALITRDMFQVMRRRIRSPFLPFLLDLLRLWRKSRKCRWDVLYVNQYFDLPIVAALGLLSPIPIVCHLRLGCPHYLSRQYRWGLMRCARLITISHHTKSTYVNAGIPADRITVVYNGIDTEAFKPVSNELDCNFPNRAFRIAYFGRLCPSKGLEVLLKAFQQLQRTLIAELHIVGNVRSPSVGADYLDQLKVLAGTQTGSRVHFREHVGDIRKDLARTDLVVLPSTCEEAFGRILIEAMASEIPVVASNVGGVPEVLCPKFEDHLVPPGDPQALAATISRLARWRTTNRSLGTACREWVIERFSHVDRLAELRSILIDTAFTGRSVHFRSPVGGRSKVTVE